MFEIKPSKSPAKSETKNISVNSNVTEVRSFAPSRLIISATLPNSQALAPELTLIT